MTKSDRQSRRQLREGSGAGYEPLNSAAPSRDQSYVKTIKPKTAGQKTYLEAIDAYNMVFGLGPAGTGKTYLAVAKAVEALEAGTVGRIILSRPAVEAGESIGYLPGDAEDKLAPYLRPLYDALSDRLNMKRVRALMAEGAIEIAPVGFMRGRTLNNAFIVVDEAQNLTYIQVKMIVTRLGWNSTMVLTGDPSQSDLSHGTSGFAYAASKLETVKKIAIVRLGDEDIVRHPLVAEMLNVLPENHEGASHEGLAPTAERPAFTGPRAVPAQHAATAG